MSQRFNPQAIKFIASKHNLHSVEELAPVLNFPKEKLSAWAEGREAPNNDEAFLLCGRSGLPLEWFAVDSEAA